MIERNILNGTVRQKKEGGFFSATDLVNIGNIYRIKNNMTPFNFYEWMRQKGVSKYVLRLKKQYGTVKIATRGRNATVWIHPYLFIRLLIEIKPTIKIYKYSWLVDELYIHENNKDLIYYAMSGVLYENAPSKAAYNKALGYIHAKVRDFNNEQRNNIYNNIYNLAFRLKDNFSAINLGLAKYYISVN